ncbi:alkyl/aryl-sulfatase [Amorphoplanes digitatis]|uniref:Alkyl sulfatase BDS1-like metallo-beta-lactamase superfamily hydrolase n=1 Tax=Actinoplanes digitatis TaxID=1868 RepID=A0A7W7I5M8_9ACTN|nr:alkyl sulfatase dimerization domain-containing protein [Actinoplanes digitatis]MBB4766915.1 alkyl sulfatase BDS1-like metallo-beta-lactamase superfamily hydrolase [Actinoplanes digitatis]GID95451.1 beta-lactamase-like protein [Actinoplanes digitatis]
MSSATDPADRGFVAALTPGVVTAPDGRVVWDADGWSARLAGECPDTVNPSLWRQGQLCSRQGLYEVTAGVYQVRGLDISNMTIVEGDTGVIVVDPLLSVETAAAALRLYRAHRGDRPVTAVIYSHSHADHFGGVAGVTDGNVPILAPVGFMEHAVAENVYAGTAMTRRAGFMYGATLPTGPAGQIGFGLGLASSTGTVSLFPPTVHITHTGQEEIVDGVRMVFQLTPGTEAPAEMNFLFPDHRALCMAENATHTMHNVLTLRGALVRDARIWSRYLTEAITLFDGRADVLFASHHWPTWGQDDMTRFLSEQRDLYAFLHDQTLRLLNQGHTGTEIAEMIQLPPALDEARHARGHYGSVSHNVKAVYQRYLGWFDGNPANLWQHPPVETAKRYVDCLGGVDAVLTHAGGYVDRGDLRFAAQLLQHAVFADPDRGEAKELLAQVYERLGYGAENGVWRNFYLTGAQELRQGPNATPVDLGGGMAAVLSIEQIFDTLAIRVDAPKAWHDTIVIDWTFTELGQSYRTTLRNGVLLQQPNPPAGQPDLSLTLTKRDLLGVLAGRGLGGIAHDGDLAALTRLAGYLDAPDPGFAIVTP